MAVTQHHVLGSALFPIPGPPCGASSAAAARLASRLGHAGNDETIARRPVRVARLGLLLLPRLLLFARPTLLCRIDGGMSPHIQNIGEPRVALSRQQKQVYDELRRTAPQPLP